MSKSKLKKSIADFKGQAMPKSQQKQLKGGQGDSNTSGETIITQDVVET